MGNARKDPVRTLKLVVTLGAIGILLLRVAFPELQIDAVSLGFVGVALLPWPSPLIKSAKLPGGFEIEFQDVKKAAERVTSAEDSTTLLPSRAPPPSYLELWTKDPTCPESDCELKSRNACVNWRRSLPSSPTAACPVAPLTRRRQGGIPKATAMVPLKG